MYVRSQSGSLITALDHPAGRLSLYFSKTRVLQTSYELFRLVDGNRVRVTRGPIVIDQEVRKAAVRS